METQKTKTLTEQADVAVVFEQYAQMGSKTIVCLLMTGENIEFIGSHMAMNAGKYDVAESKRAAKAEALKKIEAHITSIIHYNRTREALAKEKEEKDRELDDPTSIPVEDAKPLDPSLPHGKG